MDAELIDELKKEYPNYIDRIELMIMYLDKIPYDDTNNKAELLEKAQGMLNELYNLKHSDVLIDIQVIINQYRNEYDITDPREVIHYDNGRGFVQ